MLFYKVLRTNKGKKYDKTIGLIGEARTVTETSVSLVFEEVKNPDSSYNCFYYKKEDVELVEDLPARKERKEMKKADLEKGYNVAVVRFLDGMNGRLYNYAVYDICSESDLAVTDNDRLVEIVRVMTLEECEKSGQTMPYSQLKGVVDLTAYNDRMERATKRQELKKKMDERVKKLQRDQIYELYAEKDPELAELLTAYKNI